MPVYFSRSRRYPGGNIHRRSIRTGSNPKTHCRRSDQVKRSHRNITHLLTATSLSRSFSHRSSTCAGCTQTWYEQEYAAPLGRASDTSSQPRLSSGELSELAALPTIYATCPGLQSTHRTVGYD